jgi:DNA-binding response OmpR family regulator
MKLLIVDDEARMKDLLRKGLTEEGHSATCAIDGAEALALAQSYEFDVIILDMDTGKEPYALSINCAKTKGLLIDQKAG